MSVGAETYSGDTWARNLRKFSWASRFARNIAQYCATSGRLLARYLLKNLRKFELPNDLPE